MAARLDVIVDAKGAKIGSAEASRALGGVETSAKKATTAISLFNKSLAAVSVISVFTVALGKATTASIAFTDSISEVSTLLDEVPDQLTQISDQAKLQAIVFGALPANQAQAFYQIISAGASDASAATFQLTAANKLAVGGVTNVTIAADGLTSVLNVYKDRVAGASDVTDTLFVGMRMGKTTIAELASGIGRVIPLAEKSGLSFQTVVAAIAALTKGGLSTQTAIDGIRQVLASILKPTSEATTAASDLNFQFDAAALKTKGLSGFLSELEDVTDGNSATLAKFFGGVEALVPVLALMGEGAKDFSEILRAMDDRLGATDEAFRKIAESPGFATKQLNALAEVLFIDFGDNVANILIPSARLVIDNFELISDTAGTAAVSLAVAFGPQAVAMIETQFVAAVGLATTATNTFTAAIAANPIGAIAVALTAAVSALAFFGDKIEITKDGVVTLQDIFVAGWNIATSKLKDATVFWINLFADAGIFIENSIFGWSAPVDITMSDIGGGVKSGANIVIGLFSGTVKSVESIWGELPNFFSSTMVKTVNTVISGIETVINVSVNSVTDFLEKASVKTIQGLNYLISKLNNLPLVDIEPLIEPEFKENDFLFILDRIEDRADGTATRIGKNLEEIWEKSFSTDYVGNFIKEIKLAAREAARLRKQAKTDDDDKGDDSSDLPDLTEDAAARIIDIMKASAVEAEELWETSFSGGYIDRLEDMVDATRDASYRMGEAFAEVFGPGGTFQKGFADSVAQAIVFEEDIGQSMVNLGKRIAANLISKFVETQLAMQTTALVSEATSAETAAATSALNKTLLADSLASQTAMATGAIAAGAAINTAYTPASITASIATSGGAATTGATAYASAYGTMQAIAKGGALPFAKGGVFDGDIITGPTVFPLGVMGEAGPEAILPLSKNSRGELGVSVSSGGNSGPSVFSPSISVNVGNVSGGNEGAGRVVAREVEQQLELAFNDFLRKQQRPGGRLNRQRVI